MLDKKQKKFHTDSKILSKNTMVDFVKQLDYDELMKAIAHWSEPTKEVCKAEIQRRLMSSISNLQDEMGSVGSAVDNVKRAITQQIKVMKKFNYKSTQLTWLVIGIMIFSLLISISSPLGNLVYKISLKFFE